MYIMRQYKLDYGTSDVYFRNNPNNVMEHLMDYCVNNPNNTTKHLIGII